MSKNDGRTPYGRVHSVQIRSPRQGTGRRQGSPGVGNQHAGKYREWTLSRQRGGSGGNASPLPARSFRAPRSGYRSVIASSVGTVNSLSSWERVRVGSPREAI